MLERKWNLMLSELQQYFHRANLHLAKEYIERIVLKHVPKGKTLNLGCGEGPDEVTLLENYGYDTIGITVQEWMLTNPKIQIMDMHDLKFTPESFDMVYTCQAIEHSYAPWLVLAEIWTILRTNGFLVIIVPRHDQYITVNHPTMLNSERWEYILQQIGFNVINENKLFKAKNVEVQYFVAQKNTPPSNKMKNFLNKLREHHV